MSAAAEILAAPQCSEHDAWQLARGLWWVRTEHPVRYVERDGYFDTLLPRHLAVDDRIEIACGPPPCQFLSLVVVRTNGFHNAKVKTEVLQELVRP